MKPENTKAIKDVVAERKRQVEGEGFHAQHDDDHDNMELTKAAIAYCLASYTTPVDPKGYWPWSWKWWKPKSPRENLVRAAALLIAEIERLDRAAPRKDVENG